MLSNQSINFVFDYLLVITKNHTSLNKEDRGFTLNVFEEIFMINYKHNILNKGNIEGFFSIENVFYIMNNYDSKLFNILSKGNGFNKNFSNCTPEYYFWFNTRFKTLKNCLSFLLESLSMAEENQLSENCRYCKKKEITFEEYNINIFRNGIITENEESFIFHKHFNFSGESGKPDSFVYNFVNNSLLNGVGLDEDKILKGLADNLDIFPNISRFEFNALFLDNFNEISNDLFLSLEKQDKLNFLSMVYNI